MHVHDRGDPLRFAYVHPVPYVYRLTVSVIVSLAKGAFGSQAGLPVACLLVSCRAIMGRLHYTRVLAFSRVYARVV